MWTGVFRTGTFDTYEDKFKSLATKPVFSADNLSTTNGSISWEHSMAEGFSQTEMKLLSVYNNYYPTTNDGSRGLYARYAEMLYNDYNGGSENNKERGWLNKVRLAKTQNLATNITINDVPREGNHPKQTFSYRATNLPPDFKIGMNPPTYEPMKWKFTHTGYHHLYQDYLPLTQLSQRDLDIIFTAESEKGYKKGREDEFDSNRQSYRPSTNPVRNRFEWAIQEVNNGEKNKTAFLLKNSPPSTIANKYIFSAEAGKLEYLNIGVIMQLPSGFYLNGASFALPVGKIQE